MLLKFNIFCSQKVLKIKRIKQNVKELPFGYRLIPNAQPRLINCPNPPPRLDVKRRLPDYHPPELPPPEPAASMCENMHCISYFI